MDVQADKFYETSCVFRIPVQWTIRNYFPTKASFPREHKKDLNTNQIVCQSQISNLYIQVLKFELINSTVSTSVVIYSNCLFVPANVNTNDTITTNDGYISLPFETLFVMHVSNVRQGLV